MMTGRRCSLAHAAASAMSFVMRASVHCSASYNFTSAASSLFFFKQKPAYEIVRWLEFRRVLFRSLVTGRKPFIVPSPSIEAMWYQHAKITPIAPRELNIQLPIYIEQAILKAMAKERTDRHPDILTFVAALQQPSKQWLNQGYAFNNLGRFEEALAAYQQASHLNPNDASAYNGKGYALNNLGRFEEALADYQQASHLDTSLIYAYSNKGNTLNNLGRFKEALAAYQQALNIEPNFISALN